MDLQVVHKISNNEMEKLQGLAHILWLCDGKINGLKRVPKVIKKYTSNKSRDVLEEHEKQQMLELYRKGFTAREISEQVERHIQTVYKFLREHRKKKIIDGRVVYMKELKE